MINLKLYIYIVIKFEVSLTQLSLNDHSKIIISYKTLQIHLSFNNLFQEVNILVSFLINIYLYVLLINNISRNR